MVSNKEHGVTPKNTIAFSPCLLPFIGEPGCCSPLGIQGFNVQLSGENILNNFISYNFELFNSQIHLVNAINGNLSKEFKS